NVRGEGHFWMQCRPRFNYGLSEHTARSVSPRVIVFEPKDQAVPSMRLTSSVEMTLNGVDAEANFNLGVNETADFVLEGADAKDRDSKEFEKFITGALFRTINYWKEWVDQSNYNGRWRETVNRSALVLKLLTSHKFGSIVAAPTFGLPEAVGRKRNWDYRYTWIRDASFTVYALLRLGYTREAGAFMKWVEKLCEDVRGRERLGIMYSIDGTRQLRETTLENFEGYKQSRPVRVGNDAYEQLQLDIYGELLDSVYLYNKYGEPISHALWKDLEQQVDWLAGHWREPDEGIWEVRGGKREFLYSRLLSWVSLDRAIKIGEQRSFPLKSGWKEQRDRIHKSIYEDFWNSELQAFVQYKGAGNVDASTLLMPMLRFISPKDPQWLSTLARIENDLVSDSLVYRYKPGAAAPDGFRGEEGTFSMCTFWYVECLARAGQLEKARLYFEKMLGYANHLGLYSEQLGFKGEHLGNFPQAFTHLGLISAAYSLDRQLDDSRNKNVSASKPRG
ncbi:MAG TPA: glycoside hydrolase family 15 protein, partial [Bacteroidota bacterium]|nr:glycoside hydrolase family 15 protein [Bacteroidota bacterium]